MKFPFFALLFRAVLAAAVPFLAGCVNQITYDNGNSGVITQHFTERDYGDVLKMANEYCQKHGFATAAVNQVHVGCFGFVTCGTENDQYEFKCG